jgi:hypothetical protein
MSQEERLYRDASTTMEMLKEVKKSQRDLIVPHSLMDFRAIDGQIWLDVKDRSGEVASHAPLQRGALQQACIRTGSKGTQSVPFAYLDKLIDAGGQDEAAANLNFWGEQTALTQSLVRTWSGGVRAMVSDSYRIIDNFDVAISAMDEFDKINAGGGDVRLRNMFADERKLSIQAINYGASFDLNEMGSGTARRPSGYGGTGVDLYHPMVTISNSDTGHGRTSIRPGLFRTVCNNGLVAVQEFAQTHLGARQDESLFLSQETIRAKNELLFVEMRDWIRSSMNETVMREIGERLGVLKSDRVADVEVCVTGIADGCGLNEDEAKTLLNKFIGQEAQTHGANGYAMLQAITEMAHESDDPRRGLELEEFAGKIAAREVALVGLIGD